MKKRTIGNIQVRWPPSMGEPTSRVEGPQTILTWPGKAQVTIEGNVIKKIIVWSLQFFPRIK